MLWLATNRDHPLLTEDDRHALMALRRADVPAVAFCWGDIPHGMCRGDIVLIRSCWDYHLQPERFMAWLRALDEFGIRVVNGVESIEWNLHKQYLLELEREHGIAIPRTRLYRKGETIPLVEAMSALGAAEIVLKPAISLSAHETHRFDACDPIAAEVFARLLESHDVLLQAFLPEIGEGELSLVYFDNKFSHAVRKIPAPGDFRVQKDHGAQHQLVEPPEQAIAQGDRILHATGDVFAYARVDGVMVDNRFVLMELELVDPVLFFGYDEKATHRFVDVLQALIATNAAALA